MPGSELNDECNTSATGGDHDTGAVYRTALLRDENDRDEALIGKQIVTVGYAIGIVILSIGLVILTVTLAILCFLYPAKANSFLVLLASPIAVLVMTNAINISRLFRSAKKIKDAKAIEDAEKHR